MKSDDGERAKRAAERFLSMWQRQGELVAEDEALTGLFRRWLEELNAGEDREGGADGFPSDIAEATGAASGDRDVGADDGGRGGASGG